MDQVATETRPGFSRWLTFQVYGSRGHYAEIVLGSNDAGHVLVTLTAQARLTIVHDQQWIAGSGMRLVTALADDLVFLSDKAPGGDQLVGNRVQLLEYRVIAWNTFGGVVFMAGHAHAGIRIGGAHEDIVGVFVPGKTMGTVTGTAVDLAVVIQREDRLTEQLWNSHLFRRHDPYRVVVTVLVPHLPGVQDESVVAREAHAFRARYSLTAGLLDGSRLVRYQGDHIAAREIVKPRDVANGTLPFLSRGACCVGLCLQRQQQEHKHQPARPGP